MPQTEKALSTCAQSKFKVYCQRVPTKQYNNTFMCKKQSIFLQVVINLSKVIIDKVERFINALTPALKKVLVSGMRKKEKSISVVLKQRACITQE